MSGGAPVTDPLLIAAVLLCHFHTKFPASAHKTNGTPALYTQQSAMAKEQGDTRSCACIPEAAHIHSAHADWGLLCHPDSCLQRGLGPGGLQEALDMG